MNVARPIIILGAARSGTTLLGRIVGQHRDVAYWIEPNHVWRTGHAYRRIDVLDADDATPAIKARIRSAFGRFLARSGRARFAEKTPINCLRVPFVHEVFPDARFVHLIRNGVEVSMSAREQWRRGLVVEHVRAGDRQNSSFSSGSAKRTGLFTGLREGAIATRKFLAETNRLPRSFVELLEAPASVPGLLRTFGRKLAPRRTFLWGPRFPGIHRAVRERDLIEVCGMQWAACVDAVQRASRDIPAEQFLEIRFEELTADPVATLERVLHFAGLPPDSAVSEAAAELLRARPESRPSIDPRDARLLAPHVDPLLERLGYPTLGAARDA